MDNFRKTIIVLIAICLTVGYLWYGNRSITPQKATRDEVRAASSSLIALFHAGRSGQGRLPLDRYL